MVQQELLTQMVCRETALCKKGDLKFFYEANGHEDWGKHKENMQGMSAVIKQTQWNA